jgi:uncharacterized membrane protein YcjF (UPF0283 family)
MKKIFLQFILLLMSIAVFAQNDDNYQKGYNFGKKYGYYIIAALIIIIVLIVMRVMRKKKPKP